MNKNQNISTRYRRNFLKNMFTLSTMTVLPVSSHAVSDVRHNPVITNDKKSTIKNSGTRQHRIAIVIYPDMTPLDMIGPQTIFAEADCRVDLLWKNDIPVMTDLGIPIAATATFDSYDVIPDVLLIPGGIGSINCMNDKTVLDFLQTKGRNALWITSVCTGSLILASAGLLTGYKATSHWVVKDLLPLMGAIPTEGRVVIDRNRMTGGGVTAGIDFGLVLLEKLQGRASAEQVALSIEYAPAPPFHTGTPDLAGPGRTKIAMKENEDFHKIAFQAANIARERLKIL